MSRTPSQEKQTRHKRTPLPPSMLDQMEAMVRHPTFQRLLALWQSILSKNGVGLTEEEERERNAPRTKIRIAAMMEADDQWLSQSIQQIRKQGEAAWADEAVNGPWGDDTNTIPQNRRIPGDYSWDVLLPVLRRDFRQQQQQLGLVAMQRPRPHKVDKWLVCDLRKEGLTFWEITRQLFKLKGKTTYDQIAQRHYAKVRRAHRAARKLIHTLDK
jgi:hypothetical protein